MQAIVETLFDAVYLTTVITLGIRMIRGSKQGSQFRLFGWMAVILGAGDAFHLASGAIFPLRFWALSSLCCFIAAPKAMGTGLSGGCG